MESEYPICTTNALIRFWSAFGIGEIAWTDTRDHDDLVTVYADGTSRHERLCHPECAQEFEKAEQGSRR